MDLAALLNGLGREDAERALESCCAARKWVAKMLERLPFPATETVFSAASEAWNELEREDYLEAFAAHPKIGEDPAALRERFAPTARWSGEEQAGLAGSSDALLDELRQLNVSYRERFGYIFIVCATGKRAEEMLALLKFRLQHAPEEELRVAAAEQAKITRLRLEKLITHSQEQA
ncbi:MAG TPA: 2-oxo-4-hydroxy-4-carboxy-5-ureidoimidazoline decarboxylase [Polyangiaceae bacterium]|nr:2-oxo-4-hydroxy-4-carboxy-5-ureidoimidazoline decarboxylase [Polyangiaceae bacterium]